MLIIPDPTLHIEFVIGMGSFHVKSPNFQEIPHDPSQMFPKTITKNTSMCSNDTNKIFDADHY